MTKQGFSENYLDIVRYIQERKHQAKVEWNIVILRNVVLEPVLDTYLRYFAMLRGVSLNIQFGDYDNILQYIVDPANRHVLEEADCVIVFTRLEQLSRSLSRDFITLSGMQLKEEQNRVERYMCSIFKTLRERTDAMILWSGFEPPAYAPAGILDANVESNPVKTIASLNRNVLFMVEDTNNAYSLDLPQLMLQVGANRFVDWRGWHANKAPYTKEACRSIAFETIKRIALSKGQIKKCLVLDCDQTLWGGIVAEDGITGIRVGAGPIESAYYEFQQEILNLYHRGVLIALCSKNNEEDVWSVFDNHTAMLLKRKHISSYQINWNNKADNLLKIAEDLRIDPSSMVMVDDSPFEIELIRSMLPEVGTISLNATKPYEYAFLLASSGFFDTLTLSREDLHRGEMYVSNKERERIRLEYHGVSEYLHSLDMHASVSLADSAEVVRVAQLTQRTNQFNLHTIRYTEHNILEYVIRQDTDVLVMRLNDRLGEYGLIGVCILKWAEDRAIIHTFLLSCRAFGRNAEDVLLDAAVTLAASHGCKTVIGLFRETKNNVSFASYFEQKGFCYKVTEDGTDHWEMETSGYVNQTPHFIQAKRIFDRPDI